MKNKKFYIWLPLVKMRLFHFITFFLLYCVLLPAQTFELMGSDTINKTDLEGRKQGRWITFGRHKPGTCFKPDQKVEEGKYVDNKKTGKWTDYHCNGNVKNKFTFVNGKPDGYAQMFHENGKICEEGNWKNSRWVGNYKLYYENGQVQHEFVFNASGRRDGPQKYYHENGQLAIEGTFANGKESGLIKEYYENGDIKAEKNFADGTVDAASIKEYEPKKPLPKKSEIPEENAPVIKVREDEKPNEAAKAPTKGPLILNGQYTLYNRNKQITKDGIFKDNRFIEGKAYFYDENGILQRVAVYKNAIYIGDTQVEN
jgi:antitoxin component YwqK of YwqJK toxin-antitoxin module